MSLGTVRHPLYFGFLNHMPNPDEVELNGRSSDFEIWWILNDIYILLVIQAVSS
jgi:hypothetical protein